MAGGFRGRPPPSVFAGKDGGMRAKHSGGAERFGRLIRMGVSFRPAILHAREETGLGGAGLRLFGHRNGGAL